MEQTLPTERQVFSMLRKKEFKEIEILSTGERYKIEKAKTGGDQIFPFMYVFIDDNLKHQGFVQLFYNIMHVVEVNDTFITIMIEKETYYKLYRKMTYDSVIKSLEQIKVKKLDTKKDDKAVEILNDCITKLEILQAE